jgi:hypothetical protein
MSNFFLLFDFFGSFNSFALSLFMIALDDLFWFFRYENLMISRKKTSAWFKKMKFTFIYLFK